MFSLRRILKYSLILYLVYVFIFAFLFPGFQKIGIKETSLDKLSEPLGQGRFHDRAALIESPEDAVNVRLDLIEDAQSSIDISYYKFVDGEFTNIFLGSLLEAADRGVQVRILLDGILQLNNLAGRVNDIFLGFESHPNIELKVYEPFNPLVPRAWNNRLHDKVILVDSEFALLGGRNIEDRFYLKDLCQDDFVKDRDVLIYHHGPNNSETVINDIDDYYNELWDYKHSKSMFSSPGDRRLDKARACLDSLRLDHDTSKNLFLDRHFQAMEKLNWRNKTLATNNIRFISNEISRNKKEARCLNAILQLSSEAKIDMFVQSPYIIPSRAIRKSLDNYEIEVEEINLLTNSTASSPNIMGLSGYHTYRDEMITLGLNVHEYQGPGSIHAKSATFDKHLSVIGTFNLDPRSSFLSTESILIIDSEEFTENFKKEMKKNLFYSLEVDDSYNYIELEDLPAHKTSKSKGALIRVLSKIAPLFKHLL